MTSPDTTLVHATAVSVAGRGVLLIGPSGAGKSDLALRLLSSPLHSQGVPIEVHLVSDDQVVIERKGERLFASPPPTIAGKLEVRGIGIVPFPHLARAELHLAVILTPAARIERLPEDNQTHHILGLALPSVHIDGSQPGAQAKLIVAIAHKRGN